MKVITKNCEIYDVVIRGDQLFKIAVKAFGSRTSARGASLHLYDDWTKISQKATNDLYIILFEKTLLDENELNAARQSRTEGEKRFLLLPDETPRETSLENIFKLNVRSINRVHTPRLEMDDVWSFMRRFLSSLANWSRERTIADAWWEEDKLVVLSPTYERLKIPSEKIPKMNKASKKELSNFQIDNCGEFIYWPSQDMHMGWIQFEQAVNPHAKFLALQSSQEFNNKYGKAIRSIRENVNLRQFDIKGLDERTVRRIEQGQSRATIKALKKLAIAHNMKINEYLNEIAAKLKEM